MAKGNFIEYVVSDDPNKYPNGGEQNGYYYKRVITETEEKIVTPTTEDLIVTPAEGKNLSKVTVQGDANFLEENIKNGVTIWGKTGIANIEGSIPVYNTINSYQTGTRNSSTIGTAKATASISVPNEYIPICGNYGENHKVASNSSAPNYLTYPAVTSVTNFIYPDLIDVLYSNSSNSFSYTYSARAKYVRVTSILNMTFNIPYLYFTKQEDEIILKSYYNTTVETIGITKGTSYINSTFNESPTIIDLTNLVNLKTIRFFMYKNPKLKNIYLPNNLTNIDENAFEGCTNLALTSLPDGLTNIDNKAFQGCTNLALTSLPDGLTNIGNNAFEGCTNLALTSLPGGLTSISSEAFSNCTNLALTSLPNNLTSISTYAFNGCTKLALTSLPNNLTSINSNAFEGCTNLALTSLPDGLTSISTSAFEGCTGITELTFKGKPDSIASSAFNNCTNLITINVPWAEGAVANAPWGATNATINYNYTA